MRVEIIPHFKKDKTVAKVYEELVNHMIFDSYCTIEGVYEKDPKTGKSNGVLCRIGNNREIYNKIPIK
jgi:uridylate kinase